VMLIDGTVTFKSAHDTARMKDPAVLRQRAKVQLIGDEDLERRMPQRQAVVELVMNSGLHLTEKVEAVRGTMENPMTREEVVAKARDLVAPVFGVSNTTKLIDATLRLETVKSIQDLRPLLQRLG